MSLGGEEEEFEHEYVLPPLVGGVPTNGNGDPIAIAEEIGGEKLHLLCNSFFACIVLLAGWLRCHQNRSPRVCACR